MHDTISVVIPTFRRPAGLARTLSALAGQAVERLGRVYVVNDAGTGPVPPEVPEPLRDRLVRMSTPRRGPAVAANAALELVDTPLVAFLDDDSTPAEGWLSQALRLFDVHPTVTAQLGRILWSGSAGGASLGWSALIPRFRQKIYDSRHAQFTDPAFISELAVRLGLAIPQGLPGLATHLSCGNAALRMSFFRTHGAFDPALRTYQDRELAVRLLSRGGLIAYNPDMVVHHDHNPSLCAALKRCWDAAPIQRRLDDQYEALHRTLEFGAGPRGRTRLSVPLTAVERAYAGLLSVVERLARARPRARGKGMRLP